MPGLMDCDKDILLFFQMKDWCSYNLSVADVPKRALNIQVTKSGYKSFLLIKNLYISA